MNAHYFLRLFMEKEHEQPLTESIQFKVTLEINASRGLKSLDQELRGPGIWKDVMDVKTGSKK
jgi:hypothetical protein